MKKSERSAKSAERVATTEKYSRQETAMRAFIDACRSSMSSQEWNTYYPEAESSAGETFHIVEGLVFALGKLYTPISPDLRKAIDAVILECEVPREKWSELARLNYDKYWRTHYGYD